VIGFFSPPPAFVIARSVGMASPNGFEYWAGSSPLAGSDAWSSDPALAIEFYSKIAAMRAGVASAAAILGAVFAMFNWLFKMASDVAVLKAQMGEVQPVQIAKDIAWLKGAISAVAKVLHADLDEQDA
jgi:hypothetical protein